MADEPTPGGRPLRFRVFARNLTAESFADAVLRHPVGMPWTPPPAGAPPTLSVTFTVKESIDEGPWWSDFDPAWREVRLLGSDE